MIPIRFYSVLFYSILFYSILFYSILFHSISNSNSNSNSILSYSITYSCFVKYTGKKRLNFSRSKELIQKQSWKST